VSIDAATPMFNISGRLLGVLGIDTLVEQYHIHSLGLAGGAATARIPVIGPKLNVKSPNCYNKLVKKFVSRGSYV